MSEGFIQLHRRMTKWEWYDDHACFKLFVHCLLRANHKDKNWRGHEIQRGSFITSLQSLSSETGLSTQQIRTALKKLKSTGEVTDKATNKNRLISIVNWDEYQFTNKQSNNQSTSKQQAINKQATTNNNDNNDNNDNKDIVAMWLVDGSLAEADEVFELFWTEMPNTDREGNSSAANKGSKSSAKQKFMQRLKDWDDEEVQNVITQARRYSLYCSETGSPCCHVTTWLNQNRWETDYSVQRSSSGSGGKQHRGNGGQGYADKVSAAGKAAKEILQMGDD